MARSLAKSVYQKKNDWYPGSGVVLDCIDSWSLHPYLLFLFLSQNMLLKLKRTVLQQKHTLKLMGKKIFTILRSKMFFI